LRREKENNFWLQNRKFGSMVKYRMNPYKQSEVNMLLGTLAPPPPLPLGDKQKSITAIKKSRATILALSSLLLL